MNDHTIRDPASRQIPSPKPIRLIVCVRIWMFLYIITSMKRVALLIFVIFVVGLLIPLQTNAVDLPFGGQIITIFPCANGLRLTLSAPTPGMYMYTPASFSYLNGPPSHTKQWLLGMAGPSYVCLVPCHVGLCPAGAGPAIIFHGSSL